MTDTTAQHIAARDDQDLVDRFVAVAEQAGIPQADQFVRTNLGKLVSIQIPGATTITAVHAYAASVRQAAVDQLPPRPGLNPAAVTDAQLMDAVEIVWSPS